MSTDAQRKEWERRKAAALKRANKALAYRLKGWTLQRIADKLGVSRQRAHVMVKAAFTAAIKEARADPSRKPKRAVKVTA